MVINKDYDIIMDDYGTFVIVRKYTTKNGNPARKEVGYYRTLEQAINVGLTKFSMRDTELKEAKEVIKKLDDLQKAVTEALSKPKVLKTLKEVTNV